MLTGGRIDLERCGERAAQRAWLRGRSRDLTRSRA